MNKIARKLAIFLMVGFVYAGLAHAQQADFIQLYTRGKLLLKQKLYLDGIKELKRASYTSRGQSHFGVYYYLAVAYFKLSAIQQASRYLQKALPLAKNPRQKGAAKKLKRRMAALYGRFRLMPLVDPDEVGRLKMTLKPKSAFSNKYKAKFFQRLAKKLDKNGVVPNNKPIFLPKGEYTIEIHRPQCLKYGLFQNKKLATSMDVGEATVSLSLRDQPSCRCEGGQKLYRKGKQLVCECPQGLGWDKKNKRCETGKFPVATIAIITTVAVLVAGGATGLVVGLVASNTPDDRRLVKPTAGAPGLWNSK